MALKERAQGGFVVDSKKAAEKALALALELKAEIEPLEEERKELMDGVARWMKENDQKQLAIPNQSKHGTLVQRYGTSKWDGDKLLGILKDLFPNGEWRRKWQALTIRIPDSDKIQQAIKDEVVDGDEIKEAFIQGEPHKPFVQVFNDDDD